MQTQATTAGAPKANAATAAQSNASAQERAADPRSWHASSIDPLRDVALASTTGGDAALAARDALAATGLPGTVATAQEHDGDGLPIAPDAILSQQMFALLMATPATPTPDAAAGTAVADAGADAATPLPLAAVPVDPAQTAAADDAALSALLARLPAATHLPAATTATAASTAFALAAPAMAAAQAAQALATREDGDTASRAALELPDGALTSISAPQAANRPLTPQAVAATPLAMPARADDGFDDSLGARIAWMAEQKLGHAEIRLNPEHVGRIDVRIQLDGNRLAAEFSSAHADVRQALEASLPRLRDMLGQHGMQLGQADVGHRQSQGQPGQPAPTASASGHDGNRDGGIAADLAARPPAASTHSRGLLDEYA
ncbi:flagellar hook-length control protein FliK [Luteimonas sp. RIT-PG2_3]